MKIEISEVEISKAIQKWIYEQERLRWKNDERHSKFIDFLVKNIDTTIDSDAYIYNDEDIKRVYTGEEFCELLTSLFDIVEEYDREHIRSNDLNVKECDCFIFDEYILKIKNNYYSIQSIVGQGSFIRLEKLYSYEASLKEWIDYEDILKYLM